MSVLSVILIALGFTLCSVRKASPPKVKHPARKIRLNARRKHKIKKTILVILGICCVPFTSPLILVAGFISGILIGIAENFISD